MRCPYCEQETKLQVVHLTGEHLSWGKRHHYTKLKMKDERDLGDAIICAACETILKLLIIEDDLRTE